MAKFELLIKDFDKAVSQFEKAIQEKTTDEVKQAGCIQYFEFCFGAGMENLKSIHGT